MVNVYLVKIGRRYLNVRNVCQSRTINTVDGKTPLLVPSFSSRGFRLISDIHDITRDYLSDASLVSAYDVHHRRIAQDDIFTTEIVFIDSGGYEARHSFDPAEPYIDERAGEEWTQLDYKDVLSSIQSLSRIVVVNFDTCAPLANQVHDAASFFAQHPRFASDFLCKPTSVSTPFVDVKELTDSIDDLAAFDILGITEKELGDSVLERCRNVLGLRGALSRHGYEMPIHIFGCLDPPTMLAYFLCGADIFDGLAWLRFTYSRGIPIYHASSIVLEGQWADLDLDIIAAHRIQNLAMLKEQQRILRHFAQFHDIDDVTQFAGWVPNVAKLVEAAGLEL